NAAVQSRGLSEERYVEQILSGSNCGREVGECAGRKGTGLRARGFRGIKTDASGIANVPGLVGGVHLLEIHAEAKLVRSLLPAQRVAHFVGARLMELRSVDVVAGSIGERGGADHRGDAR